MKWILSCCLCICMLYARAQNITQAEYFFDTDPGTGNGEPVTVSPQGTTVNLTFSASTTGLSSGFHILAFRVKNDTAWGLFESRSVYVSNNATSAANITAAEFFIDTDPGRGLGQPMSVGTSTGGVVNFSAGIPTSSLSAGFHNLSIRTKTADGIWGLFETRAFYISSGGAASGNITAAEFFIDTDPGAGLGKPMTVGSSVGGVVNFSAPIPTTTLSSGFHNLSIRTKTSDGVWGLYETRAFYINSNGTSAADITAAEFFIDADPGTGLGKPMTVSPTGSTVNLVASVPTATLQSGFHALSIRTKDADGKWGLYESRAFYVSRNNAPAADINAAEFFIDTDPGTGLGQPMTVSPSGSIINLNAAIPTTLLTQGFHNLCIRTRDADGIWGHYETRVFYITRAATDMPSITAAEFFLDTDPGPGNAFPLAVTTAGTTVNQGFICDIPSTTANGGHMLFIRVKDDNGTWSHWDSVLVDVDNNQLPSSITNTPANLNPCNNASFNVAFETTGLFGAAQNTFTAQLSNANGSFANPSEVVNIGTVDAIPSGTNTAGVVSVTIPTNQPTGAHYRIRIVSSAPAFIGSPNNTDIIIGSVDTPTITANGPVTFCEGDSVTLTSSEATGNIWSNGATTQSIVVKTTGVFNVRVENGGCTSQPSNDILVTAVAATTSDTTVVICNKFTWHDSTYRESGIYTFIGTNAAGCDSIETLNLTILSVSSTFTKTDAVCFGSATGSITITPTSGTGPYTFRIGTVGSFGPSNTFNNLKAGKYRVSILDVTGCAGISDQVTINQNSSLSATTIITDATCNSSATGSITVNPTTGVAPYTFKLGSSGTFGSSNTFTNLRAGTYRVSFLDANNCPGTVTGMVINEPAPITATLSKTDAACFGSASGSISVTPGNGSLPFQFKLGTTGTFGASNVFNNLPAGNYTVYIQDANGCTGTAGTVVINEDAAITSTFTKTDAGCFGSSTGSITVTPTSGVAPYSFRLGTTGTFGPSGTFTNLRAGSYNVYIQDVNGCPGATPDIIVGEQPAIGATFSITNVTCFGRADGSFTATPLNGAAPHTFSLGTSGTFVNSGTFTGLRAANYSLFIKDANGCTNIIPVTVDQPLVLGQTFTATNVSCFGGSNGTVTSIPNGGNFPYQFKLGTAGTFSSNSNFSGLRAGTYRVFIEDAKGCKLSSVAPAITQPTAISFTTSKTDLTCINSNDGTITINASGGTPPYSFRVGTFGPFSTSNTFTNLAPGSYRAFVIDANNCNGGSQSVIISQGTTQCSGTTITKAIMPSTTQDDLLFDVKLFPNPTDERFNLQVYTKNKIQFITVRVVDINGKTIYTTKGLPEQTYRFGESLAPGVYLIEVRQGDVLRTVKAIKSQ